MRRKGGLDDNVSYSGSTTRKDKVKPQSCVLSSATQSTIDAGASITKSLSEGTITRHQRDAEASTISSDGIPLTRQTSSIRRVASLEPAVGKVKQDQLVDDIQSNVKSTTKAPCVDKHLMSESSSSNSSHVIVPNHLESKSQLDLSVETKPSNETVGSALVGSASLEKGELSKGIVKQLKSCEEQSSTETSQLSELQLSELLCSETLKPTESVSPETWHESTEAVCEEQRLSKSGVMSDQGPKVCGFDLNEDLEVNEVNVSEPIIVVAKVGVPNGLPSVPLRFDGEQGWKTSIGKSAFRPTNTSKKSTSSPSPKGFDLNFAPPSEPHAVGSFVEIGLKESESLTALNLNSEGSRYHARPNTQSLSFDLNDKLLADKDTSGGSLHQLDLSIQAKRNYGPIDTMNGSVKQGNVSGIRPAYWVDLSSMPGFTHVQGQPFLVAAPPSSIPSAEQKPTLLPIQPNFAFTPGLPSSGYYIGTSTGLSSSIYSPNIFPHVNGQYGPGPALPQISGPVLATYPGSLQLMETAGQGFNPIGYTAMRPNFFLNGGVGPSENANRVGNTAADKRKEPEGSWGSYQHNHRRMATWK